MKPSFSPFEADLWLSCSFLTAASLAVALRFCLMMKGFSFPRAVLSASLSCPFTVASSLLYPGVVTDWAPYCFRTLAATIYLTLSRYVSRLRPPRRHDHIAELGEEHSLAFHLKLRRYVLLAQSPAFYLLHYVTDSTLLLAIPQPSSAPRSHCSSAPATTRKSR
jgi:hypothetical protein